MINLVRVVISSEVVADRRGQTITMVAEEVQVTVIIVINTIREVVKARAIGHLSGAEDVAIMAAEEAEVTAIVEAMTNQYLMILNTDRTNIVARTIMNQVTLTTQALPNTRSITGVEEVVQDRQPAVEVIRPKNLAGAKVATLITTNIVAPTTKEEAVVADGSQALTTIRSKAMEPKDKAKVKSKVKARAVALSTAPPPHLKTVKTRECAKQIKTEVRI